MRQPRQRQAFPFEARAVIEEPAVQQLHGDERATLNVAGAKHPAHTARGNMLIDLEPICDEVTPLHA
jgi:hypothetical protein